MNKKNEPIDQPEVESNFSVQQKMYIETPTMIQISEEKLKNWFLKYRKRLEIRHSWKIPLGILVPLIFTIMTTNFKDILGIKASNIRIVWIVVIFIIIIWLIKSIINSLKSENIDKIVRELKRELQEKISLRDVEPKRSNYMKEKTKVRIDKGIPVEKSEISQIESEEEFKYMIIKAVHNAGFSHYEGIYSNLKCDILFEIKHKGLRYVMVAHYWSPQRGANLPSEQIEKYLKKAKESEASYIIATNASGLTQEAKQVLENFNRKFLKPKLFIVMGSDQNEFVQEFKKIVG